MNNLIKMTISNHLVAALCRHQQIILEMKRKIKDENFIDEFYDVSERVYLKFFKRINKKFNWQHPKLRALPIGIMVYDFFSDVFMDTSAVCDQYLKLMIGLSKRLKDGEEEFELYLDPEMHNFICRILYSE